jgi:DNA-binding response OmpR family regulator
MPRSRAQLQGPARVLVVADAPLSDLVKMTLNHGMYEVETTAKRASAEERKRAWKPHMLIVDVALRDGDARFLIGEVVRGQRIPTIVLTARGDLKTKLDAFERGADDFITVPFSPEELVARALALMRRTYGEAVPFVPVITLGALEIDLLNQHVRAGSRTLRLTAMEQALLYLLASNPGTILDRELILDTIWGADFIAESNLVDRHVRNLRVKLRDSWRSPRYIETVAGKGYRFLAQASI